MLQKKKYIIKRRKDLMMTGKIKIYKYFIINIFIFLLFISFSKIIFAEELQSFEFQKDNKIGGFAKGSGGSKKLAKNFLDEIGWSEGNNEFPDKFNTLTP